MGLILRQSIKSSIGYYSGVLVGIFNTLFFSTNFLTPSELGITRLLFESSLFFASLFHIGVPAICERYFSHIEKDDIKRNGFLSFLLLLSTIGILGFVIFFALFKGKINSYFLEKSAELIPFLWLCIPITISWIYIYVLESYSRVNQRTAVPTMLREAVFKTLNLLAIVGYGWRLYDFQTFLLLYVLSMYLILFSLLFYINKLKPIEFNLVKYFWRKPFLSNVSSYGSIAVLGAVGASIIITIDRTIIANKLGMASVAIFTIAVLIAAMVEIPSKAMRQIAGPFVAKAVFMNDKPLLKELYQKSAINMMLLGGVMLALILINLHDLLLIIPKSEVYSKAGPIILIIGIAKWLDVSLGLNAEMITYSKYYTVNTGIIIFFALLAILLNILLIDQYGLLGSAIATGLTTLFISASRLIFVFWKFKLFPFEIKSLTGVLILFFFGFCAYSIPSFGNNWLEFLFTATLRSIALIVPIIILNDYFKISLDIRNALRNIKSSVGF